MIAFSELGRLGRLGNQMFQIAATLAHAARNNDVATFPSWSYAGWFKTHLRQDFGSETTDSQYREPYFHYVPIPYKPKTDLNGYYQSEKYFADQAPLIRRQFEFIDNITQREPADCSIHVRRGDYLQKSAWHPPCTLNYYYKPAIERMRKVGCKTFQVFSDDPAWCRQHFPGMEIIEGQNEIQDLALMSKCKHQIIANSSFSWWAAWLNSNPNKSVIAPIIWFGPSYKGTNTNDVYCSSWNKM
jgi:hypothetical protein